MPVAVAERTLQSITANLGSPLVRHDQMEGRAYLVVPVIMLTEGVHKGSNGALYYPAEELSKVPGVWNMKPIVVYHPSMNGQAVSACDPVIITNRKVGLVMNTTFADGKLKAEAWLEEDRMAKVDDRIMGFLETGKVMEVSTGLFTENEATPGEWNGKEYDVIARNYRPDHLALLPDKIGACSIEDGAGLLRNHKGVDLTPRELALVEDYRLAQNEKSLTAIQRDLADLIHNQHGDEAWLEEVFEDFIIYEKGRQFYKQSYTVTKEIVRLTGLSEEVEKVVQWKFFNGTLAVNLATKEKGMDKKQFVAALIENAHTKWAEDDKEALMALEESVLEKMEPVAPEVPVGNEPGKTSDTKTDEEEAQTTPKVLINKVPVTLEAYIGDAPEELQDVLRSGVEAHNEKKGKLIGVIIANKQNTFTEEGLRTKELKELTALARLAQTAPSEGGPAMYVGLGDIAAAGGEKPEPLLLPTMNFGPDSDGK